jgi:hypothetical protein
MNSVGASDKVGDWNVDVGRSTDGTRIVIHKMKDCGGMLQWSGVEVDPATWLALITAVAKLRRFVEEQAIES